MTQAQLDAQNAADGPGADGAAAKIVGIEALAGFFASESKDPETRSRETLDSQIRVILQTYRDYMASVTTPETADAVLTARGQDMTAQRLAGMLMYDQTPAAIAHTLAVITARYDALLRDWADLYVRMAGDPDGDEDMNLDAATSLESKEAVMSAIDKAETVADSEHRTGMYL